MKATKSGIYYKIYYLRGQKVTSSVKFMKYEKKKFHLMSILEAHTRAQNWHKMSLPKLSPFNKN